MEFLPDDIAGREFLSAVGGFDREEVRQFLDALAAQVRDKNRQIEELSEKVRALQASLETAAAPSVETSSLVDVQNQARELVDELRTSLNDALSLASELRDAKQIASALSESSSSAMNEPLERPTADSVREPATNEPTTRPASDQVTTRATYVVPTVEPSREWQDLLSEPSPPDTPSP